MKPLYGVNTQVIFTPEFETTVQLIADSAGKHDAWYQIRLIEGRRVIKVAGDLRAIEAISTEFSAHLMSCFDGRCVKSFCSNSACNYLPPASIEVPLVNMSGMPL